MKFIKIKAGKFTMGSPGAEENRYDDEKQVEVTLTKDFELGETQVTQEQWEAVMGENPSHFKGEKNPVEQVSWGDCQKFIKKMNDKKDGYKYRLPKEAEWEYCCRAGTTTAYSFGYGAEGLGEYAWFCENSERKTHPVGQKNPNPWGLYDMHGNVWEWCQDFYQGKLPGGENPCVKDGRSRVVRGGSWGSIAESLRSADRYRGYPGNWYSYVGVRLLRTPVTLDTVTLSPSAPEQRREACASEVHTVRDFQPNPHQFLKLIKKEKAGPSIYYFSFEYKENEDMFILGLKTGSIRIPNQYLFYKLIQSHGINAKLLWSDTFIQQNFDIDKSLTKMRDEFGLRILLKDELKEGVRDWEFVFIKKEKEIDYSKGFSIREFIKSLMPKAEDDFVQDSSR